MLISRDAQDLGRSRQPHDLPRVWLEAVVVSGLPLNLGVVVAAVAAVVVVVVVVVEVVTSFLSSLCSHRLLHVPTVLSTL